LSQPGQSDFEWLEVDFTQSGGEVVGAMPIHFADKAQGDMKLRVVLPPRAQDAAHQIEQRPTDFGWRANGDEKAMHVFP
jgi:hypothetical protein